MDIKLSEVDLFQIYNNWTAGLEEFRCFFRSTNFVSLKHFPDFKLGQNPHKGGSYFEKISNFLKQYDFQDTFFILDIKGIEAIRTAFFLRTSFNLAPVFVFNGILHPYGLVGDREYISNLIGYGLNIQPIEKKGFILVLDNKRYGEYTDEELHRNFNNQYELGEEDFPSAEMLKLLGYSKVVCFHEDMEMDDTACYLDYLSQLEIRVEKINIQL